MSDTFDHEGDAWDSLNDEADSDGYWGVYRPSRSSEPRRTTCDRCGATDVRWRQQTGKWVLFSLQAGVVHTCPIVDDFEVVSE